MPAAEDMLEEAEEDLDRPAVDVNQGNGFRRYVEQIGGDPQQAVAGLPGRVAAILAATGVRADPYGDQANLVIRTRLGLAVQPDLDALVSDDVQRAVGIGQRPRFEHLVVAVVAQSADVAAA